MRTTSWTRQTDGFDNLAAAVVTLLERIGSPIAADDVRHVLYSHPFYPSLLAASDVLEDLDVEAYGVECGLDDLADMPLPALAHCAADGGHFVVLCRVADATVDYVDPASGPRTVPL